jgi:hypothetical protein
MIMELEVVCPTVKKSILDGNALTRQYQEELPQLV